jgi:hypothetical protein
MAMNAFHVLGGLLALWALLISFLGITREGFPGSRSSERLVAAVSVLLVLAAIGSAILSSAAEEKEKEKEKERGEGAAFLLPR